METILKGYVPQNTEKKTIDGHGSALLICFLKVIKVSDENDKCPDSILEVQSPEVLNNWLPQITAEASRSNGEPYTPRSIHQILSGLLRYMHSINDDCANFMDKIDARFRVMAASISHTFHSSR